MASSEAGLVRRTIWLLRTVAAHPDGVGLSEIARESGIPKATCSGSSPSSNARAG
ncbi:hypothetical protein SHIRM173S_00174 [Streptomyces hirsutus]